MSSKADTLTPFFFEKESIAKPVLEGLHMWSITDVRSLFLIAIGASKVKVEIKINEKFKYVDG